MEELRELVRNTVQSSRDESVAAAVIKGHLQALVAFLSLEAGAGSFSHVHARARQQEFNKHFLVEFLETLLRQIGPRWLSSLDAKDVVSLFDVFFVHPNLNAIDSFLTLASAIEWTREPTTFKHVCKLLTTFIREQPRFLHLLESAEDELQGIAGSREHPHVAQSHTEAEPAHRFAPVAEMHPLSGRPASLVNTLGSLPDRVMNRFRGRDAPPSLQAP